MYYHRNQVIFACHNNGFKPSDDRLSRRETSYNSLIHLQDSFRKEQRIHRMSAACIDNKHL